LDKGRLAGTEIAMQRDHHARHKLSRDLGGHLPRLFD
jgi:hypothetical protein